MMGMGMGMAMVMCCWKLGRMKLGLDMMEVMEMVIAMRLKTLLLPTCLTTIAEEMSQHHHIHIVVAFQLPNARVVSL